MSPETTLWLAYHFSPSLSMGKRSFWENMFFEGVSKVYFITMFQEVTIFSYSPWVCWLTFGHECAHIVFWGVCLCYKMVYRLIKVHTNVTWQKHAQKYLFSCILKVKTWHLPLVHSKISFVYILKHRAINSSIPICYAKDHNVRDVSLEKVTEVDN